MTTNHLALLALSLLLLLLGATRALKDDSYYIAGTGNPNVNSAMYWKDAENVLQDLSKFSALYVDFQSCSWSWMQAEDEDNDVDENNYWYLGKIPPMGANVAFSLYGALKGDSFSGCSRDTFINSFYTNQGFTNFVDAMSAAGVSGFSSSSSSYTAECQGGYGVGCDSSNGFAIHKYSTDECDPQYVSGIKDTLSNLNSAMSRAQCIKIYDSSSSSSSKFSGCSNYGSPYGYYGYSSNNYGNYGNNENNEEGDENNNNNNNNGNNNANSYSSYSSSSSSSSPLDLLCHSHSCFYQDVFSPDGECPDPYGLLSYYQQRFFAGIQESKSQTPYQVYQRRQDYGERLEKEKASTYIGGALFGLAFVVFLADGAFRCTRTRRKEPVTSSTKGDGIFKGEKEAQGGSGGDGIFKSGSNGNGDVNFDYEQGMVPPDDTPVVNETTSYCDTSVITDTSAYRAEDRIRQDNPQLPDLEDTRASRSFAGSVGRGGDATQPASYVPPTENMLTDGLAPPSVNNNNAPDYVPAPAGSMLMEGLASPSDNSNNTPDYVPAPAGNMLMEGLSSSASDNNNNNNNNTPDYVPAPAGSMLTDGLASPSDNNNNTPDYVPDYVPAPAGSMLMEGLASSASDNNNNNTPDYVPAPAGSMLTDGLASRSDNTNNNTNTPTHVPAPGENMLTEGLAPPSGDLEIMASRSYGRSYGGYVGDKEAMETRVTSSGEIAAYAPPTPDMVSDGLAPTTDWEILACRTSSVASSVAGGEEATTEASPTEDLVQTDSGGAKSAAEDSKISAESPLEDLVSAVYSEMETQDTAQEGLSSSSNAAPETVASVASPLGDLPGFFSSSEHAVQTKDVGVSSSPATTAASEGINDDNADASSEHVVAAASSSNTAPTEGVLATSSHDSAAAAQVAAASTGPESPDAETSDNVGVVMDENPAKAEAGVEDHEVVKQSVATEDIAGEAEPPVLEDTAAVEEEVARKEDEKVEDHHGDVKDDGSKGDKGLNDSEHGVAEDDKGDSSATTDEGKETDDDDKDEQVDGVDKVDDVDNQP